jgi:hypothetical protein
MALPVARGAARDVLETGLAEALRGMIFSFDGESCMDVPQALCQRFHLKRSRKTTFILE